MKEKSEEVKYAIKYIGENEYLNEYGCPTTNINKAYFYNNYEDALDYRNNIDVAYLYEIVKIKITTEFETLVGVRFEN